MGDPTRRLLVISPRPHPWAMLRDRLDPELVRIVWRQPGQAAGGERAWAVAGEGPDAGLDDLGWPALGWWVGAAPPGLAWPRPAEGWRQVVEAAALGLEAELAGVRLAPTCGLALPGGACVRAPVELETLLAAGPGGLPVGAGAEPALRRARAGLRRHGIPLRLVVELGVARLRPVPHTAQVEEEEGDAGAA